MLLFSSSSEKDSFSIYFINRYLLSSSLVRGLSFPFEATTEELSDFKLTFIFSN